MDNKTILVLNGPNLNLLGIREPGVYGSDSYEAVCGRIREKAAELGLRADCDQSNSCLLYTSITEYAQRLIDDLSLVDYPERVRAQQIHWIGRSTGAQVRFETTIGDPVEIYTTRDVYKRQE